MSNIVLMSHYTEWSHLNFETKYSGGIFSYLRDFGTAKLRVPSTEGLKEAFEGLSMVNNIPTMIMGMDQYNYFSAVMNGDNEKVAWLDVQNHKKRTNRRNEEYTKLSHTLSEDMFDLFWKVDMQYDRHIGYTNDILFMGSSYSYYWYSGVKIKHREYEDCEIFIKMNKSGFHLEVFYASECGYDQGVDVLHLNVSTSELFDKLKEYETNKVKQ